MDKDNQKGLANNLFVTNQQNKIYFEAFTSKELAERLLKVR